MEKYNIRFGETDDIPGIMEFIDQYWKKGHILAVDRKLFEWQYVGEGRLNMVIGLDAEENIQGVLGFIPYGTGAHKDIVPALWKANPSVDFLGMQLLRFLMQEEPHRNMVCIGVNTETSGKILQWIGWRTEAMRQWYRLGSGGQFRIAKITNKQIPHPGGRQLKFVQLYTFNDVYDTFEFEAYDTTVPYKSAYYIERRYFRHPVYDYQIYGLTEDGERISTLFVMRIQEYGESCVLRCVDIVGDIEMLRCSADAIDGVLHETGAEYIDLYETGVPESLLLKAGWLPVTGSGNIIPNYFSPYMQKNVDIYYSTNRGAVTLFRGDGDQDRPN